MNIFRDPLDSITSSDVEQVCTDEVSEGLQLELKSDLPTRTSRPDDWHTGGNFGEFARNQVAEEIIAFANTIGGVVLIGIEETTDHPHRAARPRPLPRVHELARRLRQAVHDIVDPPLPLLEAEGVDLDGGGGVVIMRVAPSRRKPHRHQANKEVYIRRADESVRIGMREIQELTIRSVAEVARVDEVIEEGRERFRSDLSDWTRLNEPTGGTRIPGGGVHIVGIPTTSFDLGRVTGRDELHPSATTLRARLGSSVYPCNWPAAKTLDWKAALRSVTAHVRSKNVLASYLLQTDGVCELRFFYGNDENRQGLYANWLVAALAFMLNWIEVIRRAGQSVGAEFALAPAICVIGSEAILAEYGVQNFRDAYGTRLPVGFHKFPTLSVGRPDDFLNLIARFDEDVWNLAGVDIRNVGMPVFEFGNE
jgi:hypothetical protein